MKYAIIIPDGAADFGLDDLDGKSALEVAKKPHLDQIAREGRQGTVVTTPAGFVTGTDVCTMSLLGYDPARYHPGRAPLEAAAMGIETGADDWIFRCNLVTVDEGIIQDHSAGHIRSTEAKQLLDDFAAAADARGLGAGLEFVAGVSYRNLMVDRSGRDYGELNTTPPHDVPGESARRHLPSGSKHSEAVRGLMALSAEVFADHEVNATRREMGESPATQVWLWGQGKPIPMPSFEQKFGVRGSMITAVDLLAGISKLIGWDRLDVPGITGYHDTDYAAKGRYACDALDEYDLVCVHVEAPDEASHQADAATKVASIEETDRQIVGPVLEKLRGFDAWRVLVIPDHYTCVGTRKHESTPPPFCMAGSRIHGVLDEPFTEAHADRSDLHIEYGHELMEYFLRGGL